MTTANTPVRLNRRQASEYLSGIHGVSVARSTLAKLATLGGGPVFESFGRTPYYRTADLDAWVASKLTRRASTSVEAAA